MMGVEIDGTQRGQRFGDWNKEDERQEDWRNDELMSRNENKENSSRGVVKLRGFGRKLLIWGWK